MEEVMTSSMPERLNGDTNKQVSELTCLPASRSVLLNGAESLTSEMEKMMGTDTMDDLLAYLDAPEVIEDEEVTIDGDFDTWMESIIGERVEEFFEEREQDEDEDSTVEDDTDWFYNSAVRGERIVRESASVKVRDAAVCRSWARKNGYTVGTRGVIAESVWAAYLAS